MQLWVQKANIVIISVKFARVGLKTDVPTPRARRFHDTLDAQITENASNSRANSYKNWR